MVNFRYHLASLVAVFLALGIGMLIGNSFVGLASVESQAQLLARLQKQITEVSQQVRASQQESAALKQRLSERDRAIRTILPRVVKNALLGRRIAIVSVGEPVRPEFLTDLSSVLQKAGAIVASTTLLSRDWLPEDMETRVRILRRLGVPPGENHEDAAMQVLGKAIVTGNWSVALHQTARDAPGLELDGDYSSPVGAAILIASPSGVSESLEAQSENSLERSLTGIWRVVGIRIVATEPEITTASLTSFFRNQDITTVDDIDTPMGQIACVLALKEGIGHFGVKPTADRLMPDLDAESDSMPYAPAMLPPKPDAAPAEKKDSG